MKKTILQILHILFLTILSIIIVGSFFYKFNFTKLSFDEIIFYLKHDVSNVDFGVIFDFVKKCIFFVLLLIIIFTGLNYDLMIIKNKKVKKIFNFLHKHNIIVTLILTIITIFIFLFNLNFFDFWKDSNKESTFIKNNYVNSKNVEINFKEKKNLIFITVESLESTFLSKEHGGLWNYEVMPELYELVSDENSISFSNNNDYARMNVIDAASWTTASLFANSSGLPFKSPVGGSSYHSDLFMYGAYTLGDLLLDNGYYNELISSATTSFGGLKEYYTRHGNYKIYDVSKVRFSDYKVSKEDLCSWGFNDNYMFNLAKKRLEEISKKEEPFNLQLVTIDTHFPEIEDRDYVVDKFDTVYENAYATDSKLIGEFISWIKEQDFYENTVIYIVGDHLNVHKGYFENVDNENRYVYNCLINSGITTTRDKNRIYTALDTFPTIVTALGGEIEGNKLGLGVNLFSDEKTLAEIYGIKYLNDELEKKSIFYNQNIVGNDYYEALDERLIKNEVK